MAVYCQICKGAVDKKDSSIFSFCGHTAAEKVTFHLSCFNKKSDEARHWRRHFYGETDDDFLWGNDDDGEDDVKKAADTYSDGSAGCAKEADSAAAASARNPQPERRQRQRIK